MLCVEVSSKDQVSKSTAELHSLFEDSFGDAFSQAAERALDRATKVIGLRDRAGSLAAAAVLEQNRMALNATSPHFGNRLKLGHVLFGACHGEGTAAWGTIGEGYRAMELLVRRCGMERVDDPTLVANLFGKLDRAKDFDLETSPEGLWVVNGSESSRPGYRQHVLLRSSWYNEIMI